MPLGIQQGVPQVHLGIQRGVPLGVPVAVVHQAVVEHQDSLVVVHQDSLAGVHQDSLAVVPQDSPVVEYLSSGPFFNWQVLDHQPGDTNFLLYILDH